MRDMPFISISLLLVFALQACTSSNMQTGEYQERKTPPICLEKEESLSEIEKNVIDEINLARTKPAFYASLIEQKGYKSDAANEAVVFLKNTGTLPPLHASGCLSGAARNHVDDIGPKGLSGHVGSDGSNFSDRINRHISRNVGGGENIRYGEHSARNIVIHLIIDANTPSRGHRKNIFSKYFKSVGAAVGHHSKYSQVCVMNFTISKILDK